MRRLEWAASPRWVVVQWALLVALVGGSNAGLGPPLAWASGAGTITGRAANGTAGGAPPAATEVVLHAYRGQTHAEDRPAQSAADGTFAFDGVETDSQSTYQVTVSYAGVTYASEAVTFGPGETAKLLDIPVYEAARTDPGLRVRRASVILAGADPTTRTIQAVEIVQLENPGDRTYVPSATGPAGPMGLLRFPLPTGAGNLTPGPGLQDFEIVQVDRGFATSMPVPPSGAEALFSYRFPFQPGRMSITRTVAYPTAELRILIPEDGVSVESPDLQPAPPLLLGGRAYRVLLARDVAARQEVELTLGGLPGRWPLNLPLDAVPAFAWGGLGAILALALVSAYAWRARQLASATAGPPARGAEPLALAEELAALDEAFADGHLPAAAYRSRRQETKARLVTALHTGGTFASGRAADPAHELAHLFRGGIDVALTSRSAGGAPDA